MYTFYIHQRRVPCNSSLLILRHMPDLSTLPQDEMGCFTEMGITSRGPSHQLKASNLGLAFTVNPAPRFDEQSLDKLTQYEMGEFIRTSAITSMLQTTYKMPRSKQAACLQSGYGKYMIFNMANYLL